MADGAYEPFPPVEAWASVAFDPALYEEYAALLEAARAGATDEARERAVRTAIRYAGTDTGAIEGLYTTDRGFTRSVAIEAAAWETAADERGPNAGALIKDQIEAYEWVLDLATKKVPVTEQFVRELHTMLCRSQETYVVRTEIGPRRQPLPKGEYKAFPNNPTLPHGRVHQFAPPDDVPPEMHRLVASVGTAAYDALHPVVQAAYLHYALAAIHPFADGNGRTARAVASVPLYRALRVPLMILADDRDEYLDSLGDADGGRLESFVRFVGDRVVDAMGLVVATVEAGDAADEAASIAALQQATATATASIEASIGAAASRLLHELREAVWERHVANPPPASIDFVEEDGLTLPEPPPGYHASGSRPAAVYVVFEAQPTGLAHAEVMLRVLISESEPRHLLAIAGDVTTVRFAIRDVHPVVRTAAKIKVAAMADRIVPALLADLAQRAEAGVRGLGQEP
ncbi:MAG TPA: Fic family protein [Frankiaceae bacterium]|nr:Fic family protein [Frankiaceae bacterium]